MPRVSSIYPPTFVAKQNKLNSFINFIKKEKETGSDIINSGEGHGGATASASTSSETGNNNEGIGSHR